jgi:hypothetical protein
MQSHVGRLETVTQPEVSRAAIRHAPIGLHVLKAGAASVAKGGVDHRRSDPLVPIFRVDGHRAQVQRVFKRAAAMRQWKRDALGDGTLAVLDDVVVHFGIVQGLQEIISFAGVVEAYGETRTDPLDRVELIVEGDRNLDVVNATST